MDITEHHLLIYLLSFLTGLCFSVDTSRCMMETVMCPPSSSWQYRSQKMNCVERTYYVCLKNKNYSLVEGCFPNYRIPRWKVGCPYVVECDPISNYPVLSADDYHECPVLEEGCPKRNHSGYHISQIYEYQQCISNPQLSNGLTTSANTTATTTLLPPLKEEKMSSNKGNEQIISNIYEVDSNTLTVILILMVVFATITVLLVVLVFYIFFRRRGYLKQRRSDRRTNLVMFKDHTGCKDDKINDDITVKTKTSMIESLKKSQPRCDIDLVKDTDYNWRKDFDKEMTVETEFLFMEKNIHGREDFERDIDIAVPAECLIDENMKKRQTSMGDVHPLKIQWVIHCDGKYSSDEICNNHVVKYCATCKEENNFCLTCGNEHSRTFPDHDVISYVNQKIRCHLHVENHIKRFCMRCQVYACDSCLHVNVDERLHYGHPLQQLSSRIDDMRTEVAAKLRNIISSITLLKTELHGLDTQEKLEINEQIMNETDQNTRTQEIGDKRNSAKKQLDILERKKRFMQRGIREGDIDILQSSINEEESIATERTPK